MRARVLATSVALAALMLALGASLRAQTLEFQATPDPFTPEGARGAWDVSVQHVTGNTWWLNIFTAATAGKNRPNGDVKVIKVQFLGPNGKLLTYTKGGATIYTLPIPTGMTSIWTRKADGDFFRGTHADALDNLGTNHAFGAFTFKGSKPVQFSMVTVDLWVDGSGGQEIHQHWSGFADPAPETAGVLAWCLAGLLPLGIALRRAAPGARGLRQRGQRLARCSLAVPSQTAGRCRPV